MGKTEVLGLFFLFVLTLLIVPSIYALSTEVKIKTVPFANANILILDPDSAETPVTLEHINKDANNYGDLSFTFSTELSRFDMSVFVKRNDQRVAYEKFRGFKTGEAVYLEIAPEGAELFYAPGDSASSNNTSNTTNTTLANNTSEVKENESLVEVDVKDTNQAKGITGLAATEDTGEKGIFSNKILYFVLGFLVLGIIVFTGALKMRSMQEMGQEKPQKQIKIKKLSEKLQEIKEDRKDKIGDYQSAIQEAELKINEAQKQINKLKNANKIEELRKKIDQDKAELEKLEND